MPPERCVCEDGCHGAGPGSIAAAAAGAEAGTEDDASGFHLEAGLKLLSPAPQNSLKKEKNPNHHIYSLILNVFPISSSSSHACPYHFII